MSLGPDVEGVITSYHSLSLSLLVPLPFPLCLLSPFLPALPPPFLLSLSLPPTLPLFSLFLLFPSLPPSSSFPGLSSLSIFDLRLTL